MLWKPINFQGVVVIDSQLVDQLEQYLNEKRNTLANEILAPFEPAKKVNLPNLSLHEAVEQLKNNVSSAIKNAEEELPAWPVIKNHFNRSCWDYVEILEGCVIEFLQQLDNIRVDRLSQQIVLEIGNLKSLLKKKIDEALDVMRELDEELNKYHYAAPLKKHPMYERLMQTVGWRTRTLDRMLFENLNKSAQFLEVRERELRQYYQGYQNLAAKAQDSARKLENYPVLNSIDLSVKTEYVQLYEFLKMWEANQKSHSLAEPELIHVLRNHCPGEKTTLLFQKYQKCLKQRLFEMSHALKTTPVEYQKNIRSSILLRLSLFSQELQSLGSTIVRYREFLLRTDPNPYVRSRLGFSEWVTGPEPRQSKELGKVGYEIEGLNSLLTSFKESLALPQDTSKTETLPLYYEINAVLHEMGQPLSSRGMMRKRADAFVEYLQQLDEFGSSSPDMIEYVGEILGKAIRVDWKYHVLHEISTFHHLYQLHIGLAGEVKDPIHQLRIQKLERFIQQVRDWSKSNELGLHHKEVEQEMQELKGILEEFLDAIKGRVLSPEELSVRRRELLDYRYLFGSFCYLYCSQQGDEVRSHYFYIDQCFEYIENNLVDKT